MFAFRHLCLMLAVAVGGIFAVPAAQAAPQQEAAAQLEALLKAHPELILDVLRNHSEELLDIVQAGSEKRRRLTLKAQWELDMEKPKNVDISGRPMGGAADAPVTVVAYSDFLCSYCHKAAFTIGNLMKRYPGKVRFIFKQTPNTKVGREAGCWFLAAYKIDKAKAWKMYALTFDRQKEVEEASTKTLRAIAREVGFDVALLETAVKAQTAEFEAQMDADAAEASRLGFVGTPYFLVNDLIVRGALPLENFSEAVEMALSQKAGK
ncbi:MAG: thioredoxin domain-containing protein [Mailhella sp.]|nr:thioredoxin domain-containing protein [Mailhella sp.]